MTEKELPAYVFASAQRALLGVITTGIRHISLEWQGLEELSFRVIYETQPSEDEIEEMEVVTTEIVADVPFNHVNPVDVVVSVAPLYELQGLAHVIYERKE